MKRIRSVVWFVIFVVSSTSVALGCITFGNDGIAVDKVQRGWDVAEPLMHRGLYARAVIALEDSQSHLSSIRNPDIRRCVASGAGIRLAAARAGAAVLTQRPSDVAGAEQAADRAWRAYPMPHNCP